MSAVETARARLQGLETPSIEFRLLGALLTHAPTLEGQGVIATNIIAVSAEPDGLVQLAKFYTTGLLLTMKAGGQTPKVSFHPSRDLGIQSEAEAIAVDLETAKRDQAMLKKYALRRDGYRCVVTHRWDFSSLPHVQNQITPSDPLVNTEAAHILPYSLMKADTNMTLFKKCKIWTVIKSFTNIEFTELNGENINSLTNVLTLDAQVHNFFGTLRLWFEAVQGRPNTYIVRKSPPNLIPHIVAEGTEVTFTSSNLEMLPLPNLRYLAFHAAIAKVMHMAGMAEYLEDIIRRHESIRVLSDESDAEYLDGLLRIAQNVLSHIDTLDLTQNG